MVGTNFFAKKTSTLDIALTDENGLALFAKCTGTPPTTAGVFQHGCILIKTDGASGTKAIYENVGTPASPIWNVVGEITTAEIGDGAVTKTKLGYKAVAVTVSAGNTSGSSSTDSTLVGGEIIGIYPTGNQDQLVDDVALNTDGSVTVTLAAAATNNNTFKVVVLKP